MSSQTIGGIVIVILIILGGWWLLSGKEPAPAPAQSTTSVATTTETGGPNTSGTASKLVITYTDKGFSPAAVSISEGRTVTFVNDSSRQMWVAANEHPSHMDYDGSSKTAHCAASYTGAAPFDECAPVARGTSYDHTFTKVGTWTYHNHVAASDEGEITVTAATGTTVNSAL